MVWASPPQSFRPEKSSANFYPHDDMRVKKLLRYMYVCMYVCMWRTSCHHIKFLVKICMFEHFGITKCDCYMYVCMYVVYKLAPHKIFSKNIIPNGFGHMLLIKLYGS